MKKSNEEVKVIAMNALYKFSEEFYNYEKAHFAQFIGKDIFKVDGSIKQKFDHAKMDFKGKLEDGTNVMANYWFNKAHGSFDIHVKICVSGGSYEVTPATAFCQYEEQTLEMFKVDSDNLLQESSNDISWLQKRYNLADLKTAKKEIEKAAEAYRAACEKMPWRFHDVFYVERLSR